MKINTYVMHDQDECILSDLVMLRYELCLCMWITLMASKWDYLVYVGVCDSMCTLHM